MNFESIRDFFSTVTLWQEVVGGLILALILAILGLFKKKKINKAPSSKISVGQEMKNSNIYAANQGQVAIGDKTINLAPGATLTLNTYNYQDGVAESKISEVKDYFKTGLAYYSEGKFEEAITAFQSALEREIDPEKRGALNLQIGNCYYNTQKYLNSAEYYGISLKEARKAGDKQGEASALASIANTYIYRPASSGNIRGENIRHAVENYRKALAIFNQDEYPSEYALTQNNLGNAYNALPAASPEERAENIKKAIACYKEALDIWKKDQYPHKFCYAAENLGIMLLELGDKESILWLEEAYQLREFLPDQGKMLEQILKEIKVKETD